MFEQRLKDEYVQQWYERIHTSSKLTAYTGFKYVYEHERYIQYINIRKFGRILTQFRVSAHGLEIEKGRYSGIARSDRICKLCQLSIEDEYHFLLICDICKGLRDKYLPRQIVQSPSVFKFNRLLSASNEHTLNNLALFHTTERRTRYIDSLNNNPRN